MKFIEKLELHNQSIHQHECLQMALWKTIKPFKIRMTRLIAILLSTQILIYAEYHMTMASHLALILVQSVGLESAHCLYGLRTIQYRPLRICEIINYKYTLQLLKYIRNNEQKCRAPCSLVWLCSIYSRLPQFAPSKPGLHLHL